MGLFSNIGCKIIDVLDSGFDTFSNTVDNILEKAEDLRSTIENGIIDAECNIKNTISDIKYTIATKDLEGIKYISQDIFTLVDEVTDTQIQITKDVSSILNSYNQLIDQANYIQNIFNVNKDVAYRLANKYNSIRG